MNSNMSIKNKTNKNELIKYTPSPRTNRSYAAAVARNSNYNPTK